MNTKEKDVELVFRRDLRDGKRAKIDARDLDILNREADLLNAEAEDSLEYQADPLRAETE